MIIPFLILGSPEPAPPKEPARRTIRVELPDPLCRLPLGQEALPLLYALCRAIATSTSLELDAAPQIVAWWFAQGLGDDDLDRISDEDA